MIVRELLTKLGFDSDETKVRRYEKAIATLKVGLIAAVAASTALGVAAGALAAQTARYGDELAKTADKLGVTVDGLERLRYASERGGVGAGTLDMALQRMTRRLSEAAQGSGEAKGAIEELGLNAQALATMGPEKAILAISDALAGVPNQTDKVRLAFKFFDSEGVALVNMLGDGSAEVRALSAEFERLSGGLTDEQARAAEGFTDALLNAQTVMQGLRLQIGARLLPVMQPLVDSFTEFMATNREFIMMRVEDAFEAISRVISMMGRIAGGVFGVFERLLGSIEGLDGNLAAIVAVIAAVAAAFGKLRATLMFGGFLLALDDIAAWMDGQPSLIGKLLGPFEDFAEKAKKVADALGGIDRIVKAGAMLTLAVYVAKLARSLLGLGASLVALGSGGAAGGLGVMAKLASLAKLGPAGVILGAVAPTATGDGTIDGNPATNDFMELSPEEQQALVNAEQTSAGGSSSVIINDNRRVEITPPAGTNQTVIDDMVREFERLMNEQANNAASSLEAQ